jgi:hypothetical protein
LTEQIERTKGDTIAEARKGHSKASAFYLLIKIPEAPSYIIHAPPHSRFFEVLFPDSL